MTLLELETEYARSRSECEAARKRRDRLSAQWTAAQQWFELPDDVQTELLSIPDDVVQELRRVIGRSGKQWPTVPNKLLLPYRFDETVRTIGAEILAAHGAEWLRGLSRGES